MASTCAGAMTLTKAAEIACVGDSAAVACTSDTAGTAIGADKTAESATDAVVTATLTVFGAD